MGQKPQSRLDSILGVLMFLGMIAALYMAFLQAPREKTMEICNGSFTSMSRRQCWL